MTNSVRRTIIAAGALALATLLAAPGALAADTVNQSLSFDPGQRLEVDTARGSIEYHSGAGRGLTVTITCDDGRIADHLDLAFENTPTGARITARKVGGDSHGGWLSGLFGGNGNSPRIKFLIEGPERADLDLKTAGGHIDLDDLEGAVRVATSGGHINFAGIRGRMDANTSGGHIRGGTLSEGGDLRTSGGHISIDGAGRDLDVRTSGGHITIGPVEGNLNAATSGGRIVVGHVAGSMDLSTSGGSVKAEDGCDGDAEVSSSGGSIVLEDMGGHVSARTSGGHMRLTLSDGNGAGADLSTSGGSITIRIPPGVGFDIDASAPGAEVIADVRDLKRAGHTKKDRLEGTVAGGGRTLRLRSQNGDIRITDSNGR